MSGGAYDYLYGWHPEFHVPADRMDSLKEMADRLRSFGLHDAAEATEKAVRIIHQLEGQLDALDLTLEPLREVWREVEWNDSGDGGDIDRAVKEWRKMGGAP